MRVIQYIQSLLWSQRKIIAWVTLTLAIVIGWAFFQRHAILDYMESRNSRDHERQRVESLRLQVDRLDHERATFAHDAFERQKVARERYRMSKPGEQVLYLEPAPGYAEDTSTSLTAENAGGSSSDAP